MSIEEKAIKKSYSFLYYKGDNIIVDNDTIFTNKSNNKHTAGHQSHFLLCRACFWCATICYMTAATQRSSSVLSAIIPK
jgi:hypothetical protein